MKNLKQLSLLFLGLLMISCQRESIDTNEELDLNLLKENSNTQIMTEAEEFENRMQWASYVSAKLLVGSSSHQTLFTSELGTGDTIQLNEILGNPFSSFYQDFRDYFIWYFTLDGSVPDPDQNPNRPPPPPGSGQGGFTEPTPEEEADYMIDYLVNQNCVEFYFPVGLSFNVFEDPSSSFTLTTTAHPLTGGASNNGVKRYSTLRYSQQHPLGTYTAAVTVNEEYVNASNSENIIVSRPYRVTEEICPYNEYEIDFENFLD